MRPLNNPRASHSVSIGFGELRRQFLASALKSSLFKKNLARAAAEIQRGARPDASEATIESQFERVLYAALREIGLDFNPEKEVQVHRHLGKGRLDSQIGAVVIEYKRPAHLSTPSQISQAKRQLIEYLTHLSHQLDSPLAGFITNGKSILELRIEKGEIISVSSLEELNSESLQRLVQSLVALDLRALTPKNLIQEFCGTDYEGALFDLARSLQASLAKEASPKTDMLFSEWQELFRLAHNDQSQQRRIEERREALGVIFRTDIQNPTDEYKSLFALHTAYASVLKLIGYRIISFLSFGERLDDYESLVGSDAKTLRIFCDDLENGKSLRELGMLNLLEGDFFSWYSDKAQWTPVIAAGIKSIIRLLSRYESAPNIFSPDRAIDLFRHLYEATVPQVIRASFGEFYTPTWLSMNVLDSAKLAVGWRTLDPCCGSGTFLVTAIMRLRSECGRLSRKVLLSEILARVVGIDLNPLAVLMARINYFFHIADLVELGQDIHIPVYLGDASYVPETSKEGSVELLSYRLKTLKASLAVVLPKSLVNNAPRFLKTMHAYEQEIIALDHLGAIAALAEATAEKDRSPEVLAHFENLTSQLLDLESRGWNGIWGRIISNFMITGCLGKFTAIIGNPPWIDWKNLPSGYRDKIKEFSLSQGLFSGAGRTGGINLNVCALIAHVASKNWLSGKGILAFLMPRELALQASYEGWRRLPGQPSRGFLRFHDWTDAGHPFEPVKEDFMTYVIGPKLSQRKHVPVTFYRKRRESKKAASTWADTREACNNLEITQGFASQVVPGSTVFTFAKSLQDLEQFAKIAGSCAYIGREGIEFYPQELLLFKYVGPGPKPRTVIVENLQNPRSKFRIERKKIVLEEIYLFPLVKGPAIRRFEHDYNGLIVAFPYTEKDVHRPISASQLRKESPFLYRYYQQFEEIISAQTKFSDKIRGEHPGEFYGLARTGAYSFAEAFVAFRDNSKWCAAVLSKTEMPWGGKKRFLFQNHAVSMCERATGGFVGIEEAHYVCAILNAPVVEKFIFATSDERSFKIRPPVYVPLFDRQDERHRDLARLSRLCHRDPQAADVLRLEIDRIYLSMCRERKLSG
jgi:hypothetical protein